MDAEQTLDNISSGWFCRFYGKSYVSCMQQFSASSLHLLHLGCNAQML